MTNEPSWDPQLYEDKHSFVWKLANSIVEQLAPQPGERILDVGCGTGHLTAQIAEFGAELVGLDHSQEMIDQAIHNFPDMHFVQADVQNFDLGDSFDAVFSNAALHWIQDPRATIRCLASALKPGGRLVAEFGGRGNVMHVVRGITEAFQNVTGSQRDHPWYFPSIGEFSSLLEQHGLETTHAALIDRPTRLDGSDGLRNWVRMFGGHWLESLNEEEIDELLKQVDEIARPQLQRDATWYADYRRLRVVAIKTKAVNETR